MIVLVAGASSELGRAVAAALVQRGHTVRTLSRRPVEGHADHVIGDLTDPTSLPAAVDGVEVVVSTVGAPILSPWHRRATFERVDHQGNAALAVAAAAAGVRRMVYVSVAGNHPDGLEYVDAHRRAEAAIRDAGLQAAVVRATGFFGALRGLIPAARLGILAVPGSGTVRTNPISELDLAEVIADQVAADEAGIVEVGGPEILTRRRIGEIAFEAIGRRPRIVAVPTSLLWAASRILRPIHRRVADLLAFFAAIHESDGIAPCVGEHTLIEAMRQTGSR